MGKKQELKAEIQRLERINLELTEATQLEAIALKTKIKSLEQINAVFIETAELENIEGHFRMFVSDTDVETMVAFYLLFVRNVDNLTPHLNVSEKSRRFINKMQGVMLSKKTPWNLFSEKSPVCAFPTKEGDFESEKILIKNASGFIYEAIATRYPEQSSTAFYTAESRDFKDGDIFSCEVPINDVVEWMEIPKN